MKGEKKRLNVNVRNTKNIFSCLFSSEIVKAIQGSKSNITKALYRHSSSITHSPVQTGLLKRRCY